MKIDGFKIFEAIHIKEHGTVQKCGSTSRALNDNMKAFIEQKKLKLSVKKCVKIHIGAKCDKCYELLVHDEFMQESHEGLIQQ